MNKKKKIIGIVAGITLFVIVLGLMFVYWNSTRVYAQYITEAGTELEASDFLKNPKQKATFAEDSKKIDTSIPGDYIVKIKSGIFTYDCMIKVQDTIAPQGETQKVTTQIGVQIEADSFFKSIKDETKVKASFAEEIDYQTYGEQTVKLILTDCAGNTSNFEETLVISPLYQEVAIEAGESLPDVKEFLIDKEISAQFADSVKNIMLNQSGDWVVEILINGENIFESILRITDTTAPQFQGLKELRAYVSGSVDYEKGITVTDNSNEEISFTVDNSKVDINTVGEYPITYTATDKSGNTSTETVKLLVLDLPYEVSMEAGNEFPSINKFFKEEVQNPVFVTDMSTINRNHIGDYEVELRANEQVYMALLHIVDTTTPQLELQSLQTYEKKQIKIESFISSCKDATEIRYSYVKAPDTNQIGTQEIIIRAMDEGGNYIDKTTTLVVNQDTEAPVIHDAHDMVVYLGSKVMYKAGISVTDNSDEDLSVSVDSSQVNLNVEGTYPVIYSAVDSAGNITTQTITLTVKALVYTEEEIYALAQQVLKKIFTDGMSDYDKLQAIYNWVRANVSYVNYTDKSDWKKAAYEAFTLHKGDCYAYASVSKALLNAAGIANKDIEKIPTKVLHFWNLVDIGEGWHHFDACPRMNQDRSFCYITDAVLMDYSKKQGGTHGYDRSVYTDIK